jgi:hypothetical protein
VEGGNIGANGIYDLGTVDYNGVYKFVDSGYESLIEAVSGHVYMIKLADGNKSPILV